jgi:hypothetical protein
VMANHGAHFVCYRAPPEGGYWAPCRANCSARLGVDYRAHELGDELSQMQLSGHGEPLNRAAIGTPCFLLL